MTFVILLALASLFINLEWWWLVTPTLMACFVMGISTR